MADLIGEFIARFRAAALQGLDVGGGEAQDFIETTISTPVGRGAGGAVVERSKPEQQPRLDTGDLHANISHSTWDRGNIVGVTVSATRPSNPDVPGYLERGTMKMGRRPFMRPGMDNFAASRKEIVVDTIKAEL